MVGGKRRNQVALIGQQPADSLMEKRDVALPLRVARIGLGKALRNGEAVALGRERCLELTLIREHVANLAIGDDERTLPLGIAWVVFGKPLLDRKALREGFEGAGEIALRLQNIADHFMRAREAGLPVGIVGVELCEPFGDGKLGLVGFECGGEAALCAQRLAEPLIGDRQIVLRRRVARIGPGDALEHGKRLAERFYRLGKLAFYLESRADLGVGHRKLALPFEVVWLALGESASDRQALPIGFDRLVKLALRLQHIADLRAGEGEAVLPLFPVGLGLGKGGNNRKALAIGLQCPAEIALRPQDVADAAMRYEKVVLPKLVGRIGGGEAFDDGERFSRGVFLLGGVALRRISMRKLGKHVGLKTEQLRIIVGLCHELADHLFRRAENFAYRRGAHAFLVAQGLGDIEDQRVRALLGHREVALGFRTLLDRFAAVDLGPHGEAGEEDGDRREACDPIPLLAPSLALGAAENVVGGNAEQPGNDLGKRQRLAVAFLARVGGQQLDGRAGDLAVSVQLEFEGRGEALGVRVTRLAADDQRDDGPLGVPRFEQPNFFRDIGALGGGRRADDDQRGGRIERGERLVAERMAGGEVVAVAEDGPQGFGYGPALGLTPDQVLVDAERLQPAVQPLGPSRVGMAVGDEGAVFVRDGLRHDPTHPRRSYRSFRYYPRATPASQLTVP